MKKSVLIILSIVAIGLSFCKNNEENPFGDKLGDINAKSDPIKVLGEVSVFGDFPLELVSNGKLNALNKASMEFRANGITSRINFKNGQLVRSGELIAELENSMEKLDLDQAEMRLEKARIERLNRIMGHEVGASTPEDVPEEVLKKFNIITGFTEAELAMEQARLRYEYTRLVAPFTGRIANLETKVNNAPKSGEPFCILIDDAKFEVLFPVMESEIGRLAVGQEVTMKPFFMDSVYYRGKISEINPWINEHGMVQVKAIVDNKDRKLVDGMNVKVFIRDKVPGCLIVPKEAVVLRNNRQVVFTLRNDTTAYWNYVTTDLENSRSYSIIEGINPGDTVITVGNLNLAHDARVDFKLKEEE